MIAIGNLTGDPVLKTNEETGKPYAIMRIASDRRYKSPDGEKLTDFISIKVRGVLAERCAEFARKGCKIAATKLSWNDSNVNLVVMFGREVPKSCGWNACEKSSVPSKILSRRARLR